MNLSTFWRYVKFTFKVAYHCIIVLTISFSIFYTYLVDQVMTNRIYNLNVNFIEFRYEVLNDLYETYLQVSSISTTLVKLQFNLNHFYESIQSDIESTKVPDYMKLQKSNIRIKQGWGGGSGTVIKINEEYTYILTARHVVDSGEKIEVEIPMKDKGYKNNKGTNYIGAGVEYVTVEDTDIYLHKSKDIALIRIKTIKGHDLAETPIAKKEGNIGDVVYVIGNPIRLIDNITRGLYSCDRLWRDEEHMVVSAPIIFGNSGGAVVNNKGELLGVISSISQFEMKKYKVYVFHIGLAVPYNTIVPFIDEAYKNIGNEKQLKNENQKETEPKYNFTFNQND